MAYDAIGKTPEQLAADQRRAKSDPFFLSEVLGYDFQADVHKELFEQFPMPRSGVAMPDFSEHKNSLILWPRGHFKTSATVLTIVQIILTWPDVRIMLMGATVKHAKKWLAEIKSHFNGKNPNSGLIALFGPKWRLEHGSGNNAMAFTIPTRVRMHLKDPTVAVASNKSIETGAHCDYFFADDLVNTGNYRNPEIQDDLEESFAHFVPLLDPGGYTVVTGTRYTAFDVYGRIIKRGGQWQISIKASYDQNGVLLFTQRQLKDGRKIGFTREILDQIQKDDPVTFTAQYMNAIFAAGRQIFPRELIYSCVRSTKDPAFPHNSTCFFSVDLAESEKAEADHSVVAIGRRDANGALWLEDVVGHTWTPGQFATILLNLVLKYRPRIVFFQKAIGTKAFMELVMVLADQKGIAVQMDLVDISNQKDAKYVRISSLEPEFKNKRLFLSAGINNFERLEEEFTQFPKGRHDDRPDAIATLAQKLNQAAPIYAKTRIIVRGGFAGEPGEPAPEQEFSRGQQTLGGDFAC